MRHDWERTEQKTGGAVESRSAIVVDRRLDVDPQDGTETLVDVVRALIVDDTGSVVAQQGAELAAVVAAGAITPAEAAQLTAIADKLRPHLLAARGYAKR